MILNENSINTATNQELIRITQQLIREHSLKVKDAHGLPGLDNIDGGSAVSVYGGTTTIDGGTA